MLVLKKDKRKHMRKLSRKPLIIILGVAMFIVLFTIGSIVILFSVYGVYFPKNNYSNSPVSYQIEWNNDLNLKQSHNTCGAYSSMAYVYLKNKQIKNPEEINSQITEKYGDNYIFPWGIINYCKKQGVNAKIYWFGFKNNSFKIKWIENRISTNEPVILIVGNSKSTHYITIMGYDERDFMMYDSNSKNDKNGILTGNSSMSKTKLINWWNTAKFYRIPINGCISK